MEFNELKTKADVKKLADESLPKSWESFAPTRAVAQIYRTLPEGELSDKARRDLKWAFRTCQNVMKHNRERNKNLRETAIAKVRDRLSLRDRPRGSRWEKE